MTSLRNGLIAIMLLTGYFVSAEVGTDAPESPTPARVEAAPAVVIPNPVPGPFQSDRQTVVMPPEAQKREATARQKERERKIQRIEEELKSPDLSEKKKKRLEQRLGELRAKELLRTPPPVNP